jgi:magnesium and cobalt exporter, CNNM family
VTVLYIAVDIAAAVLLVFASLLQLLYLESLRLRVREYAALEYFRETLEDKIGTGKTEDGALAFSLVKHTCLVLLGLLSIMIGLADGARFWEAALAGGLLSLAAMIVLSYLIPQIVYRRSRGRWLASLVPFAKLLVLLTAPFAWMLNFVYSLADIGNAIESQQEPADAAEHIEALISAGEEEGLIEEDDRKLIQSVVAFGDKTVREVMAPRPNIVAIEADKTLEDLRQLVLREQYSRIPVYENNIDQILGFVHVRDMFELDQEERRYRKVRELNRPIRLVPETKPVNDLLREMQQDGAHMAIVIDEYGNTAGLVTMEDMVEVIVGEIHDEHEPERDIVVEPNGSYVVSGSFDLDRVEELFDLRLDEETESTTIGGLVTEWLGRVPAAGESVERDGVRIEVLAGNELRVEQVRISRARPVENAEQAEKVRHQ